MQTTLGLYTHRDKVDVYVEVEKPYYIDSEGYLQGLGIIKAPRPKLTEKTGNFQSNPIAIILHRTQSPTAASTLETWKKSPYGTHFLIDTDGTIYQCASLHKYTQHVGDIKVKNLDINDKNYKNKTYTQASNIEKTKSYPNRYPINSDSIGIEVVGSFLGNDKKLSKYDKIFKYVQLSGEWEKVTVAQKSSVKSLVEVLKAIFGLSNDDIYKHGAISGHKQASEGDGIL